MSEKIGIIDSGIGGFTLLNELFSRSYFCQYYYISDNENVPYGTKSQLFMLQRVRLMVNKLKQKKIQTIVIACNTLTAETIEQLREEFHELNFIGIEPYLNYFNKNEICNNKKMALILTEATYKSLRFTKLRKRVDPTQKILTYPLANLASLIEGMESRHCIENLKQEIDTELAFLHSSNIDYLILGCTHYPIIKKYIEKTYDLQTLDPNKEVVDRIVQVAALAKSTDCNSFYYNPNLSHDWQCLSLTNINIFTKLFRTYGN
jgi:glutamate racemase